MNSLFMPVQCPGAGCHRSYDFVKDGIFSYMCANDKVRGGLVQCEYSKSLLLMPLIYNAIHGYLYDKTEEFYRAPYKCHECTKRWTMSRRCCGKLPTKVYSTSELHSTIYNLLRVLNNTQQAALPGVGGRGLAPKFR